MNSLLSVCGLRARVGLLVKAADVSKPPEVDLWLRGWSWFWTAQASSLG